MSIPIVINPSTYIEVQAYQYDSKGQVVIHQESLTGKVKVVTLSKEDLQKILASME